jgi:murein L,D-transpeptidase YafK
VRHAGRLLIKILALAFAVASAASCSLPIDEIGPWPRTGSVSASTMRLMDNLDMDHGAPVLIRIFKEERTLEVWKQNRGGKFALLRSYSICKFSGGLGPKILEGDRQAPEGFYDITPEQLNPLSREYLAFNIGYPNAFDRSLLRTGSVLMVHGGCKSIGCYAMTDEQMREIYGLVDEAFKAGQERVQLQAFPFRLTTQNLARHSSDRNAPFWAMLKQGSDAFQDALQPPTIGVCDRHYIFNSPVPDSELNPTEACPPGITQELIAGVGDPVPPEPPAPIRLARSHLHLMLARRMNGRAHLASLVAHHVVSPRVAALCRLRHHAHGPCMAGSQSHG